MNKQECKKYLKRAYKKLIENKENMNVKNIENNMKLVLEQQASEYIAYSKIAVNNMLNELDNETASDDMANLISETLINKIFDEVKNSI